MAKVRAEHVHQISPSAKPELLSDKDGYVKIRLTYLTMEPKHIRSTMLRVQGISPPFMEEVSILMPQSRVFPLIETFMPAFEHLQESAVVARGSSLQSFKIVEEDTHTLAYLF